MAILLNSDVFGVTSKEMWQAMESATVYGGPEGGKYVEALYERIREITGMEDALLVPSCTMANLTAQCVWADSGDQVIYEEQCHSLWSEEWGMAYVARVFPKVILGRKGILDPADVAFAMDDSRLKHKPKTALLCLENTHMGAGGTCYTKERIDELCEVAHSRGAAVHLDGARLFNAAIALNTPVKDLLENVDSVSINLNKGLAALEGTLLCGSKDFIDKSKIFVKRIGGNSMHKNDVLAAAGLIALRDENISALEEDHKRAKVFAEEINKIKGVSVDMETVQSNIVLGDISETGIDVDTFVAKLKENGLYSLRKDTKSIRFVFHNGITDEDLPMAVKAMATVAAGK